MDALFQYAFKFILILEKTFQEKVQTTANKRKLIKILLENSIIS